MKATAHLLRIIFPLLLIILLLTLIVPSDQQAAPQLTIVEFSDFQCPYCRRAADVVEQVRTYYGERVQVVFKQMPLRMHANAFRAAQASVCAGEQGRFWEYHDRLFASSDLSVAALNQLALEVGLQPENFRQCLSSERSKAEVKRDMAEAEQLGVTGTPTFFINRKPVKGAVTFAALKAQIDQELDQRMVRNNHASISRIASPKLPTEGTIPLVASPTPTPAPPITLSQASIDFGYQLLGTTSQQTTETVINSGTAPLVIKDISVSGRDRGDFTLNYNFTLPLTLAPGNNVAIELTFTPALPWRAGSRKAKLEIDQKKGSSSVSLSGIGATCGGPFPGCLSGCADADGDGLNDAWEATGGVDLNNDGRIDAKNDLLLSGADRDQPDIFVWYDWMDYGGDDQSCATAFDCEGLGTYHNGETCLGQGQCVYSCSTDSDCTSRSPTGAHVGERCVSNVCEHTHDPLVLDANTFEPVIERFAAHGINLHILRGNAQPHSHVVSLRSNAQMSGNCEGASIGSSGGVGPGKYAVSLHDLKATSNPDLYGLAYHYALFAHYAGCDSSSHCPANGGNISNCSDPNLAYGQAGLAELSGNDFIVSLGGVVNDSGLAPRPHVTITFMHELGHNLGLRHNGHLDQPCPNGTGCPAGDTCSDTGDGQGQVCHAKVDESNYKPNYLSIMNYMYEGSGILVANRLGSITPRGCSNDADCGGRGAICLGACVRIDYSDQTLPTSGPTPGALDESCLDDTLGLGSGTADIFKYMDGSCHTCPHLAPATGPVDWKGAGLVTNNLCQFIGTPTYTFTDTCVTADINQTDYSICDPSASEILHGHTDWPDISGIPFNYKFQRTVAGKN